MRYLGSLVLVLAIVASPLSVGADVEDEGKSAESADTPQPAPQGLERWHPEAFVDPPSAQQTKPEFEIEYVPANPEEAAKRRRKRAIALGVTIPIIVVGVGLGIGAAVAMSHWDMSWD